MKRSFLIPGVILLISYSGRIYSQCPVDSFDVSNQACSGQGITINNLTTGASTYNWDFCGGDFTTTPVATTDPTNIPGPRSFDTYYDGSNWFGFTVNKDTWTIGRFDFGNSLDNIPTFTDIGNPGGFLSGIVSNNLSIYQEGGNWYGLLSIFSSTFLIKYEFGASLSNASPIASTIAYPFGHTGCQFQQLIQDNGNLFLFAGNALNPIITRYAFGNSIMNAPVIDTFQVAGVGELNHIRLVKYCDQWIGFGVSFNANTLFRFNFGSDPASIPTIENLGNIGMGFINPISLGIVQDAGRWYAVVQNFNNNTLLIDMGNNPNNSASGFSSTSVNSAGGNYVNIIKDSSEYYVFLPNVATGHFLVLKFSTPCSASQPEFSGSNPSGITYTALSTNRITLEAIDASGNTSYFTDSVNVNSSPVPMMTTQFTCFGDQTEFRDASTIASDTINYWHWDFGNGDSSIIQNPDYQYSAIGSYVVSLTTTASSGCSATYSKNIYVSSVPVCSFINGTGCSGSVLNFQDQSTTATGTIVDWLWDFGNGDTTSIQNPAYTYPGGGNFLVQLTVTTDSGCYNSYFTNIAIQDRPTGGFDVSNTCVGQFAQFTDFSTVNGAVLTGYHWNFGDGDSALISNPSHQYPGGVATYPVEMIVMASNGCSDTVNQTIKINNIPTANFSFIPAVVCQGNDVQFTDLSSVTGDTINAWLWDFGDLTTDTVANPLHTYNTPGLKTITLTAYSPSRCPSSIFTQSVNVVQSPVASFSFTDACYGSGTSFTDLSQAATGDPLSGWYWDFGNGDYSSSNQPTFQFPASGMQSVILQVTSSQGCSDTVTMEVPVHAQPTASFTHSIPCENQQVQFINTSAADSASTFSSYSWNIIDPRNGIIHFSNQQNASYAFDTSMTFYAFMIATNNFGCSDTALDTIDVRSASTVNFTYSPTCYGSLMEFFNPGSASDSTYLWNFGDNQFNQLREPAHFYAFPGTYNVTLSVMAMSGCISTATKTVAVSPIPVPDFRTAVICEDNTFQFIDSSRISSGSIVKWNWSISSLGVTDTAQNPFVLFNDTGSYNVTLQVTSDIGCAKAVTKSVKVHPLPVANFNFNPQFGSPPLSVQFQDFSSGGASYIWDFGDGTAVDFSHQPVHIYQDTGLFSIHQYVITNFGCMDSAIKNVYVIKPVLDIAVVSDSSYIDGDYFHFVARISNLGTRDIDSVKMEASLDDGTTILENNISIIPAGQNGQRTYHFQAALLLSDAKHFNYYCIRASSPNGSSDDVPGNNELCVNQSGEILILNPYPNPFTDQLNIRILLPFRNDISIGLYDFTGKKVRDIYDNTAAKGVLDLEENLSDLSDGIYSVRVQFRDEVTSRNVIKNSRP